MTAATLDAGTPPRPTTSTWSAPPDARGATDGAPLPVRVSRMRVGGNGRYRPSAPEGITTFDPPDWLAPTVFVAVTLKLYEVPLLSPVMIAQVCVPATVAVTQPDDEVTEEWVLGMTSSPGGATASVAGTQT